MSDRLDVFDTGYVLQKWPDMSNINKYIQQKSRVCPAKVRNLSKITSRGVWIETVGGVAFNIREGI
jgi:hypothetical protein